MASLDWKEEATKSAQEFKEREAILTKELGPALKQKFDQQKAQRAKPPGTPGAGGRPPGSGAQGPTGPSRPGLGIGSDTEPGMAGPPGSAEGTGTADMALDKPGPGGSDIG